MSSGIGNGLLTIWTKVQFHQKPSTKKNNNNKGRKGNQKWMVFSEAEMAPCHTYPVVCPPEMGIDPGPYSIM